MRYLEDIKEMLCAELKDYANKTSMSGADLETIHKLTDTIKNIDKIKMYSEVEDGSSFRRGSSYDDEDSYSNRGKHYVRGYYSRDDGYSENSSYENNGYSERRRYSRDDAKEHMIKQLRGMMNDADGKEKEAIHHCIKQLENA